MRMAGGEVGQSSYSIWFVEGEGAGGPSWPCSFITTQMDSDESGGFLLVLVVTHTPDGDPVVRPQPGGTARVYCPGTYGQLMELPESCMSRISVSMGVFPTSRMKKSCEMRLAGTARRAGRRSSRRPKR